MSRFDFNDFRNKNFGNNRNSNNDGKQRGPVPPGLGGGGLVLALIFVIGFAVLLGVYKGVENISAMDIFLMAAVAFVITRLVRRNGAQQNDERNASPDKNRFREQNRNRFQTRDDDDYERQEEDEAEAYWRRREEEEARFNGRDEGERESGYESPKYDPWDRYRSLPEDGGSRDTPAAGPAMRNVASGFDRNEFIAGAKILFEKIQEAVAAKNLAPIQSFLTDRATSDLAQELESQPAPQSCKVLSIEAAIRDIREKGEATVVSVNYEAVVHFGNDEAPREIKTTWRFRRDNDDASWQLDSTHA